MQLRSAGFVASLEMMCRIEDGTVWNKILHGAVCGHALREASGRCWCELEPSLKQQQVTARPTGIFDQPNQSQRGYSWVSIGDFKTRETECRGPTFCMELSNSLGSRCALSAFFLVDRFAARRLVTDFWRNACSMVQYTYKGLPTALSNSPSKSGSLARAHGFTCTQFRRISHCMPSLSKPLGLQCKAPGYPRLGEDDKVFDALYSRSPHSVPHQFDASCILRRGEKATAADRTICFSCQIGRWSWCFGRGVDGVFTEIFHFQF